MMNGPLTGALFKIPMGQFLKVLIHKTTALLELPAIHIH